MFLYCACVYIYIYTVYIWIGMAWYGSKNGRMDRSGRMERVVMRTRWDGMDHGDRGSRVGSGYGIWVLQLEPRPYMYYIYTHNNYIYNIILYCKYLYLYANTNIYSIDTSYPSTHLSCLLQRCLWSLCPILPGHRIFGVTLEEELVAHVVHNHILRARGVQLGSSTCSKWT